MRHILRSPVATGSLAAVAVFASFTALATEPNAEAKAWFDQQYGSAITSATTEQSRVDLATQLMQYVDANTRSSLDDEAKARLLYAARQAYQLGKDHYPAGYRQAALALMAMQKIDRPNRLDYTERLAAMVNQAWGRGRTKYLGSGIEFAQVKLQVAQQRMADLFDAYASGDEPPAKSEVINVIDRCKRDYQQALSAANSVLDTATKYRARVGGAQRAALTEFIERHTPLRDRIRDGLDNLRAFGAEYAAIGDEAFPTEVVAARATRADEPKETGDPSPTTDLPSRPVPRPPVASVNPPEAQPPVEVKAKPEPAPRPEPEPVPEPEPEPDVKPDPAPAPTTASRPITRKQFWGQATCDKCGESFATEFDSPATTCYWCLKKDNIFSGANE